MYSEWTAVIFVLRKASDGDALREVAHEFSRRCPGKYDRRAVDRVWDSARADGGGGLGIGSLVMWIRDDAGMGASASFVSLLAPRSQGQEVPPSSPSWRTHLDNKRRAVVAAQEETAQKRAATTTTYFRRGSTSTITATAEA